MANIEENYQGVNIYDDSLVNKTGLGCGCDVTQSIGVGACKTQILDFDLLKTVGGVECETSRKLIKKDETGENYSKMTEKINLSLTGKVKAAFMGLAFGRTLDSHVGSTTGHSDDYEYGTSMIYQKLYTLNIKPSLLSHLKDFIPILAWNEINATDSNNRTNKDEIKKIFGKYGTHLTTRAVYGCMSSTYIVREQNEWESGMDVMISIENSGGGNIKGVDVDGSIKVSFSNEDSQCFKNSCKVVTEKRIGGANASADTQAWLDSCTLDNPDSVALIGYNIDGSESSDSGLIPLYELLPSDDPRYCAMKDALDEYIDENTLKLTTHKMVILDIYAKRFDKGQVAPTYCYGIDGNSGNHNKYFRLEENVFDHVTGAKKGCLYFYYALGHATGNAVVDVRFDEKGDFDGDWQIRGSNSNEGVTGCLKDRYVGVKIKNVNNGVSQDDFVTGFGLEIDKKLKVISKGTEMNFDWIKNGDCESWYSSGLIHDDVYCKYTKDELINF